MREPYKETLRFLLAMALISAAALALVYVLELYKS